MWLAVALTAGGCFADRNLGGFGDDEAVASTESPTGMATGEGADLPEDWPPPGLDMVPDVGDGTFRGDMLLIVESFVGPFRFIGDLERLGDTFQGSISVAVFDNGAWERVGASATLDVNDRVFGNLVGFTVPELTLPDGTHPFGVGPKDVEVGVVAGLYTDRLLCGTLDVFVGSTLEVDEAPFVAVPLVGVVNDPNPPLQCTF